MPPKLTGIRLRKFAILLIVLFFCIWGIWFVVIPKSLIADYIVESFGDRGVNVVIAGLKKGFLGTVHIERAIIGPQPHRRTPFSAEKNIQYQSSSYENRRQKEGVQGLVVQKIDIAPDLLSFLKLSPRLNFSGRAGKGVIRGFIVGKWRGVTVNVEAADLQVSDLAFFENAGISGEGTLSFNLEWRNEKGNLKFSIDSAKLRGHLPGINSLPMELFQSVKGLIGIGELITVHPLTLEGPGLYVRVKGNIRESNFDGRVELMLDSSSDSYNLLQTIMARYSQSPGYYVIPDVHADLLSGSNL